jgi:hypothetical protein
VQLRTTSRSLRFVMNTGYLDRLDTSGLFDTEMPMGQAAYSPT